MDIRPQAMAIPAETDHLDKGKYGPIYPKTPACYGFSILAKIIPGRESVFHEYAKNIEAAVKDQPDVLAPLKLHYLRWLLFPINGDTYFMYQGIFDTEFDKYTEDAVALFGAARCQDGVREPRGLSEGLADQPGRVRQDLCARTRSRASLNTASIPSSALMKSRRP